jgi:lysophospholipase L1-like esterase
LYYSDILEDLWFNQIMSALKLFAVLGVLFLVACANFVTTPVPTPQPIRYLALGDSYTIGQSVAETERWPNQLAAALSKEGFQTEVTIIARTGWTANELWQGIQADSPHGTFDLVTLLIGVNDQYRGYDVDGYREQFCSLLGKSIEYAGGNSDHVIVLSIPDWSVTRFAMGMRVDLISKEIGIFNAVNREETESAGAHYVNITPISQQVLDDSSLIASDGLHPSGKMYKLWVEKALPTVFEIFN